jgi:hypothetical protein
MKRIALLQVALLLSAVMSAQVTLDYFLPKDVNYKKEIPPPKQFTGFEVGEWHLSHDELYLIISGILRN